MENMENELINVAMNIILEAGDARTFIHQAVKSAAEDNIDEVLSYMKQADQKIIEAHKCQTVVVQNEARGKSYDYSLLMTHAMDTLMTIVSEYNITCNMLLLSKNIHVK